MADALRRRLAAILAADVVGYSRLMEADEGGTLQQLKLLRSTILEPSVDRHSGRIVKLMGDGVLVEFGSAVDAVTCAIDVQRRIREHHEESPGPHILFRMGINVGDIIVEGDDIYGDGVNVAARIEALAEPGGVYISRTAADHVRDKLSIRMECMGTRAMKNISRPIEVYCVQCHELGDDGAEAPPAPQVAMSHKPAIAVMAFSNRSSDPEQEYFSDGISEDIITDLSKLPDLRVIARNSSFAFKGQALSAAEVARQLGVRYVLDCSVRKAGERVRVTAQLVDATTSEPIWTERFDRGLEDIFEVQDELTREIVGALQLTLAPELRGRRGREDRAVEAYRLFLEGREHTWAHTRAGSVRGRQLLERAIELSPRYAAAHARVAFTHTLDYMNAWSDDPERSRELALETARRALEMDADEPQGHFAMAVASLWSKDIEGAIAHADRCIVLEPSSAEGYVVKAHAQVFAGLQAEAQRNIAAYMQLDPLYPAIILYFLAESYLSEGRYQDAVDALRRRLARDPDSATTHALLASCFGHLGQHEEARASWTRALALEPSFDMERRRRVLPFKDPQDFERRLDGLRLAGIC